MAQMQLLRRCPAGCPAVRQCDAPSQIRLPQPAAWGLCQQRSRVPHQQQQQQRHAQQCTVATRASGGQDEPVSIEELFAAELASRQAAEANQAEVAAAAVFDGAALLALLR